MDFFRLRKVLTAWYGAQNPAIRADHAERLAAKVQAWAKTAGAADYDLDLLTTLAHLLPVRTQVLATAANRGTLEAFLVEQGWPPLRCRELFHSLERLPDKPKLPEELLVADADTLQQFGVLGFARQLAICTERGLSLADCAEAILRSLSRKIHTPVGQLEAQKPRQVLRELVAELKRALG